MINDVYTDRRLVQCTLYTSIQNDHFIGIVLQFVKRMKNDTQRLKRLLEKGDDFFVVAFYLLVRTTHFIAVPMIAFHLSSFFSSFLQLSSNALSVPSKE